MQIKKKIGEDGEMQSYINRTSPLSYSLYDQQITKVSLKERFFLTSFN